MKVVPGGHNLHQLTSGADFTASYIRYTVALSSCSPKAARQPYSFLGDIRSGTNVYLSTYVSIRSAKWEDAGRAMRF